MRSSRFNRLIDDSHDDHKNGFGDQRFHSSQPGRPLIDSNGNYVRYEMRMNQPEYEAIVNNKWYIADNLPVMVQFPSGTSNPNQYGSPRN